MSANFALEWQPLLLSNLAKQEELVDRTLIHCTQAFLMKEEYIVTLFSWTLDTKHQIQSQSHWQCTQLHKSRLSAETLKTVDLSKAWHWCQSHAVHFHHGHLTFRWRTQLPGGKNLLPAAHYILHTETGSQWATQPQRQESDRTRKWQSFLVCNEWKQKQTQKKWISKKLSKERMYSRQCQSNTKAQQQIHNSHLSDGAGESKLWW